MPSPSTASTAWSSTRPATAPPRMWSLASVPPRTSSSATDDPTTQRRVSAGAERGAVEGGHVFDLDGRDLRPRWTDPAPRLHRGNGRRGALRLHGHRSVGLVAGEPRHAESRRLPLGRGSEPHPLHVAADPQPASHATSVRALSLHPQSVSGLSSDRRSATSGPYAPAVPEYADVAPAMVAGAARHLHGVAGRIRGGGVDRCALDGAQEDVRPRPHRRGRPATPPTPAPRAPAVRPRS